MEVLDVLKTVHDISVREAKHLRFNKKDPWILYLVCLYASMIEMSSTIVLCIESKRRIGVPILFRSLLEAYVDFKNLAADRSYLNHMQITWHKELLRALRAAKGGGNPYLSDIQRASNLDSEIRARSSELDRLRGKGCRSFSVAERFKKAGMVKEYDSLYAIMCGHTHSDISGLIDRHIEISGNDFIVVSYKDECLECFLPYIESTCEWVIHASQEVHKVLKTSREKVFDDMAQKLGNVRSS